MKPFRLFAALGLALILPSAFATPASSVSPHTLWYRQPATQWVEALPVGNGRLGAMVFGGTEWERIQLNEDTLWAGSPYDPTNPEARAALPEIRRLHAEGRHKEAQALTQEKFMAKPMTQAQYQTVGDLILSMAGGDAAREYRRELDLDTGIARTEFRVGDNRYVREVFASPVDQLIVVRFTTTAARKSWWPPRFSLTLSMRTPQAAQCTAEPDGELALIGRNTGFAGIPGDLAFEARVRIAETDGTVSNVGGQVHVTNASTLVLHIAAATSFRTLQDVTGNPATANRLVLDAAREKRFETLLEASVAEHRRLFRRADLDLGHSPAADLPTDERVRAADLAKDPALAALYFQYGRYLLLCSSRPGTQPANLQGIWNDSLTPPWGSKYTININTQMNYWPAEVTNLAECAEPLFAMVHELARTGERTAREQYGADGWVAHHNTDLWRATGPIDGAPWGMWPTGGAWLCEHLWEHWLFSGDREFLARSYPAMKGSAQFFLSSLVEDPKEGWLVTSPSLSPENEHHDGVSNVAGPTMDSQILRDLFSHCASAARLLGRDTDFAAKLDAARARLAPNRVGKDGQLMEWLEDWDAQAPDIHHRHVSHLYGFFPSNQITLRGEPALASAVRKTLETRGDMSTGWATAWRLNLWARMQDGDRAFSILAGLLGPERTYPNLFDAHPPFQIDGNLGGAAGIAELLLQSHAGEIELLPALPKAWPTGKATGLRARGNLTIDLSWTGGHLTQATLHGSPGQPVHLRHGKTSIQLVLPANGILVWTGSDR